MNRWSAYVEAVTGAYSDVLFLAKVNPGRDGWYIGQGNILRDI